MNSKQGKIGLLVSIFVVTVTALVIWNFVGSGINTLYASNIRPFLMSEDDIRKEEQEKLEQERLLEAVEVIKNDFKKLIKDCDTSSDTRCLCEGHVNFEELSDKFHIMITSTKAGTSFSNQIELLDKSLVSLPNKAPEYLGNFVILPEDEYDVFDFNEKLDDYKKNDHDLRFSSDELRLRTGKKNPKVTDKMDSIFFAKPVSGVITIHDDGTPYVGLCV